MLLRSCTACVARACVCVLAAALRVTLHTACCMRAYMLLVLVHTPHTTYARYILYRGAYLRTVCMCMYAYTTPHVATARAAAVAHAVRWLHA